MPEIISRDKLRGYVKWLVFSLKHIHDPKLFDPNMRFRDGPKMIINIEEDGKIIIAHFHYLGHYNLKFPLFPKSKISEITDEDIKSLLGNEEVAINAITDKVYELFNQFK